MSQYRPDIGNLLATVRGFLDGLAPRLDADTKFQCQVASHVVGICERQLVLGERFDAEERERYATFLGAEGSLEDLTAQLCDAIRSGRLDDRWDELVRLVLAQAVRDVQVVRPSHLDPGHRP
jgi:hypothetical protein